MARVTVPVGEARAQRFASAASRCERMLLAMHDLRYAWRVFVKNPTFTIVIVLTLALGIGANTAVFSIVNGVLLRPLPYPEPDRLVMILQRSTTNPLLSKAFGSYADYKEYALHAQTLERLAGIRWAAGGTILSGRGQAKGVVLNLVTEDFFSLLGAQAAKGCTFAHDDMQRGCSVVISDSFWRGMLGSDPHIIGQSLTLNRNSCTVAGVMPASFAFYPHQTEVWRLVNDQETESAERVLMVGVGRLKRGVTLAQAEADLAILNKAIHQGQGIGTVTEGYLGERIGAGACRDRYRLIDQARFHDVSIAIKINRGDGLKGRVAASGGLGAGASLRGYRKAGGR